MVVVLGGALAAGSANALNCYIDRDIDEIMRRTSSRPLVRHTVSPRSALVFGLVLGVVSVALFAATTNLLAAGLTLAAIVYYVVIYTMLLKRHTSQSTLWGGVCGAAPVVIAWAAATGSLSWPAWLLFGVVFFWQPPHFWALAIKYRDDYRRAGIPMLPVVASVRRVLAESVVYSWLMVAVSLARVALGGPVLRRGRDRGGRRVPVRGAPAAAPVARRAAVTADERRRPARHDAPVPPVDPVPDAWCSPPSRPAPSSASTSPGQNGFAKRRNRVEPARPAVRIATDRAGPRGPDDAPNVNKPAGRSCFSRRP